MAAAAAALAVARCISDIEVADFVALDLEFSGLFLSTIRDGALSLEAYYKKCRESIPQFLPLQLGICCVRHLPQTDQAGDGSGGVAAGSLWELRSHEFNLWPQDRRIFTSDLQSLRFLRAHGFDFNAFFDHAHTYCRLPAPDAQELPGFVKRLAPSHASRVFAALRSAQIPLVVHNGLLDLLHLHDKFLGDLPETYQEFAAAWASQFPLLFDTRLIAQEGRFQVFRHSGHLSLEELQRQLTTLPEGLGSGKGPRFERVAPPASASRGEGAKGTAHGSSAFDAMLTAEVFLMEVDRWIRSADGGASRKRRRKSTQAAPDAEDGEGAWTTVGAGRGDDGCVGLASPAYLESHAVCRRFQNRLAIVAASPGFIDLGRPSGLSAAAPAHPEALGAEA